MYAVEFTRETDYRITPRQAQFAAAYAAGYDAADFAPVPAEYADDADLAGYWADGYDANGDRS